MADTGTATIVYETHDEFVRHELDNEEIAYFDDHWLVWVGEDHSGDDRIRRIPRERVYYVERTTDELEEKLADAKEFVESKIDW